MRALNLASRPFRNEVVPATLFALGAAAVLALTAWQLLEARRLTAAAGRTSSQRTQDLRRELAELRSEAAALQGRRVERERIEEWELVRDIVDQRTFSWTALLARLEEILPPGVRLLSIDPRFGEGEAALGLHALARGTEEGFGFARALNEAPEFGRVWLLELAPKENGDEFEYEAIYRPGLHAAGEAGP